MTRVRIPVRVGTAPVPTRTSYREQVGAAEAVDALAGEPESVPLAEPETVEAPEVVPSKAGSLASGSLETVALEDSYSSLEESEWRERALRLKAEMDNYRRRQRRAAQEAARAEQERLLDDVLGVADNLERTLAAQAPGSGVPASGVPDLGAIRRGVELTHDELMRVLLKHDVERFDAQGAPFDPAWHEAVHVVPAGALGVEPGTVVKVVRSGYRRGERLLRPAQVVVAN